MSTLKLTGSSSGHAQLTVAAAAGTPTFTLPTTVGTAGQVLMSDGSGNLSWTDNTPMWLVKLGSDYSHTSSNSWVTAPLASEEYDTDNAFNTSTYTFTVPSGKGGKYFLYYQAQVNDNPDDGENIQTRINKNGTALQLSYDIGFSVGTNKTTKCHHSWVETLAAGDALTMSIYQNEGGTVTFDDNYNFFGGYRLIGG